VVGCDRVVPVTVLLSAERLSDVSKAQTLYS